MTDGFRVHNGPGAPALDGLVDGSPVLPDRECGDVNDATATGQTRTWCP